jgi:tellurite methyltransferase
MSRPDEREHWNQKYREKPEAWRTPDAFLAEAYGGFIQPAFPGGGTALDVAGGAGRHSIWLAERGWEVTLIDILDFAVELARQNAGILSPHIRFVVDDLTGFWAAQTHFDVVMGFFYLEREIFPDILRALRLGGLLVYKTYTIEQLSRKGGPKDPAYLLGAGELRQMVGGLEILHYQETVGDKATAEVVARKG